MRHPLPDRQEVAGVTLQGDPHRSGLRRRLFLESVVQAFGEGAKRNRRAAQQRVFFSKGRNFREQTGNRFAVRPRAFVSAPPTTDDRASIRGVSPIPFRP
jgi:hypothetical protein